MYGNKNHCIRKISELQYHRWQQQQQQQQRILLLLPVLK